MKIENNVLVDIYGDDVVDGSIVIPEGVTKIDEFAFAGCENLTSIVIPKSVKKIADDAFTDCTNLTTVELRNPNVIIGKYAFYGCPNVVLHLPLENSKTEAIA